jgi:hypothetical protein
VLLARFPPNPKPHATGNNEWCDQNCEQTGEKKNEADPQELFLEAHGFALAVKAYREKRCCANPSAWSR